MNKKTQSADFPVLPSDSACDLPTASSHTELDHLMELDRLTLPCNVCERKPCYRSLLSRGLKLSRGET
ncbi:Uncharacterized protein DAT39_010991 [Clarias magur]|uniref:Uncharacterized protein n=1 Tax=Clarias magur TaxID=1594786 RepID=A0A8J4TJR5_CLAMG|nr:Uncharacterized protein DAT39_010991 [Clarias magur]